MVQVSPPIQPQSGSWRDITMLLAGVGKRNPLPLIALTILTIIGNTRTGLYVLALGGITQALINADRDRAIVWALVFLGSGVLEQLYWPFKNHLNSMVQDDAGVFLQKRVLRRAATIPLENYENARFFNRLTRANDDLGHRSAMIISSAVDLLQVLVMFVSILAPVWFVDPNIVWLIVLGCIPVFFTTWRTARAFHEVKTRNAHNELYASKLSNLILQRDSAAEIRLFGTGPEMIRRWHYARNRIADDSVQAVGIISRGQILGEVFAALGMAGAIALLVQNMIDGRAPLGSLVAVVFAITWGVQMVGSIAVATRSVRENSIFLGDIFALELESQRFEHHVTRVIRSSREPMALGIRNVSFRYPDTDRDVVRDLSLEIAPGEHIALLGENGAGKSTLVQLIAGLYQPTSGSVYQDDVAATNNRDDIGAVLQNFVRWQLPLRDNVGFGDASRLGDDTTLLEALAKADLYSLPEELGEGLDSWLGREFGDRDLSGGQWQRIAIARAFFRDARLLILDEPTAALDPLAEQRLFERFNELAASKTTITISHRIGSARTADRIVVMDAGQIVEIGTHEQLLQANGTYASMFQQQQEWYKREDESFNSASE